MTKLVVKGEVLKGDKIFLLGMMMRALLKV